MVRYASYQRGFYEMNYDILDWRFVGGHNREYFGIIENRRCRFCRKSALEGASFRKLAHLVSEFLGNKRLFCNYECDECNEKFGCGIETDLANYLQPYRTLAHMKGKNGYPALKDEGAGWRISGGTTGINVEHHGDNRIFEVDEDARSITFRLLRGAYRPVNVYKSLMKYAISFIPETEISFFSDTIDWLSEKSILAYDTAYCGETFIDGWQPIKGLTLVLLRRKWPTRELPYMMFVLCFRNLSFQIAVPSIEKDKHLLGQKMSYPLFPTVIEVFQKDAVVSHSMIDLNSSEIRKDDIHEMHFGFEKIERVS